MIQIGNDKIKDIYVGSDKIKEVYYGSEKVWGKIPAIQDGYWVHKDTNAVTYFGADADFITGGIMSSPSWKDDCSEVQIPSGVTGLGSSCFPFCDALTSINIPESVVSLGAFCFRDCSSLPSINIPESVTSLGNSCLQGCSLLTSINIPEGVTSLGNSCFRFCSSLALATVLPSTPPTLGTRVFDGVHTSFNIKVRSPYVNTYKTATNWIEYTNKISAIGAGYWVHKDTGVKTYFDLDDPSIENGVMSPPSWRGDCSEVNIPVGVTSLGYACFSGSPFTSITLPESVTSLGQVCFSGCASLTSITLPESLTSIGGDCFAFCTALTSITLPESVTSLGEYCFQFCEALTLATVLPATPPSLGTSAFRGNHSSFNIKVRPPYVNDYKTATNWSEYADKISAI